MNNNTIPGSSSPEDIGKLLNTTQSKAAKKAYNYKYYETIGEHFYRQLIIPKQRIKDDLVNINLANGNGEEYMKMVMGPKLSDIVQKTVGIELPYNEVLYHDFLTPIIKQMTGAMRNQRLVPYAEDLSENAYNQFTLERTKLIQQKLQTDIIDPLRMQALEELQREQPDLFKAPQMPQDGTPDPQAQQQAQQQQQQIEELTQTKVQSKTYAEIFDYLAHDFTLQQTNEAQLFLKILMDELKIKFYTDEGYKLMLPLGREVHYLASDERKVTYKLCNPMNFNCILPKGKLFYTEAIACMYTDLVPISEVLVEYGDELDEEDLLSLAFGNEPSWQAIADTTLIGIMSDDPNWQERYDITTQQGQHALYTEVDRRAGRGAFRQGLAGTTHMVEVSHIVWQTTQLMKRIEKPNASGGKDIFFVDELHAEDELAGEKYTMIKVPQWCECTRLSIRNNQRYVRKRPIPNQYNGHDPFHVEGPYIGADYGTFLGSVEPRSPVSNAKTWILKLNVLLALMHKREANNIGTVLALLSQMKPEAYLDHEWFQLLKEKNILLLDADMEQLQAVQYMPKTLNLSNTADQAAQLNMFAFYKEHMIWNMAHNPNSLGYASPYISVKNNESNIQVANLQAADMLVYHDLIVEKVLNALYKHGKLHYSKNPYKRMVHMDDLSQMDLSMDWALQGESLMQIKIKTLLDQDKKIADLKALIIEMVKVRPNLLDETDLITLVFSENYAQLKTLMRKAKKNRLQQEEQQRQYEQELAKQQQEAAKELEDIRAKAMLEREKLISQTKIQAEQERSTLLQKGYDVDGDKVHDMQRIAEIETKSEEKIAAAKIEADILLQNLERNKAIEIEKMSNEIDAYVADVQARSKNKK